MRVMQLFDIIIDAIRRLNLNHGLTDDEARELIGAADKVNAVRELVADRLTTELTPEKGDEETDTLENTCPD